MSADVVGFLSQSVDTAGYAEVLAPESVVFPAAGGPHPDYQTEWWYYTGNLTATTGAERFGYQLTFFRRALAPPAAQDSARRSAWATNQVYLAHFATTDVAAERHTSAERFARGAAGLAGAVADPFRVWLEGWAAEAASAVSPRLDQAGLADALTPVHLVAADGATAIDLTLTPVKAPVLHGDAGYSRKGDARGSASMYYSLTRLRTTGRITTTSGGTPVDGWSWMDHEWSTSALSSRQVGWDWFALQLDDGTELMLFQLREGGGAISPTSGGTLIETGGTRLTVKDFAIQPTGRSWVSPRTGARYPSAWRVVVPRAELTLEVTPLVADQELDVGFKYWEGAVAVTGRRHGDAVGGVGYVELTGYAPSGAGGLLPGLP